MAHGTWKTTGGGGGGTLAAAGLIAAAVLLGSGALAGAVAALTSLLEIVLACTVAAVVMVTAGAVVVWRRYGHRPAPIPEQITAMHEARQVRAAQRPAIAPAPAQLNIHFHGDTQPEAVLRAISQTQQQGEPR
jgi:hypothetical protein